jgi:hypothetical protein
MSVELLQHSWHGEKGGDPFMQLPGFIHSKTDEKDDELAFHLDRHAGANYFCHFKSGETARGGLRLWNGRLRHFT